MKVIVANRWYINLAASKLELWYPCCSKLFQSSQIVYLMVPAIYMTIQDWDHLANEINILFIAWCISQLMKISSVRKI